MPKVCQICYKEACIRCPICKAFAYCSRRHARQHYQGVHVGECERMARQMSRADVGPAFKRFFLYFYSWKLQETAQSPTNYWYNGLLMRILQYRRSAMQCQHGSGRWAFNINKDIPVRLSARIGNVCQPSACRVCWMHLKNIKDLLRCLI